MPIKYVYYKRDVTLGFYSILVSITCVLFLKGVTKKRTQSRKDRADALL